MDRKVLICGCFDLLHAGHIAFFKTAAQIGKLFVAVGADENVRKLKGTAPYFSQEERVYMVNSIRYVESAFVAAGSGMLDFEPDMRRIRPDVFVVNHDGHTPGKEALCKKLGVDYTIMERIPEPGLPARASSTTKQELQFPYRICIAGGWMDQPWVSEIHPGSVVVAQLLPTMEFHDRSGMATSSRRVAFEVWGNSLPQGNPLVNAKLLFGAENPPGSQYISGSQDHIGLLNPGISRLYYDGKYWPSRIDSTRDKNLCEWLSSIIHLIPLEPRPTGYDPLLEKHLTGDIVRELGCAGEQCWTSILQRDAAGVGTSMTRTLLAWKKMLPYTVPDDVMKEMETKFFPFTLGATLSGSGGGYAVVVSEKEIAGSLKIKIMF
ncbi:MAG: adenylyltransferase/cytidyltransferase family protein [Bacteroidota bacterium]